MNKNHNNIILGIDIGTTGCKCVAFNSQLKIVAEAVKEYPLIHGSGGISEQNPEDWWLAVLETIKALGVNTGSVKGIGISSQGISVVPVDEFGKPLMNAITWLDMRAGDQCKELGNKLDKVSIYKSTGKRINPAYSLFKLMWIKLNNPEMFIKTHKFLLAHDYIIYKLCGAFVTEHSLAAGTLAYDINYMDWNKVILETAGIPIEKLPKILQSGTIAGTLTEEAVRLTGLNADVVVSTGGQDQKCAAFGAGLSINDITVSLGTSFAVTALYDKPIFLDDMSLPCFPYIDGKNWVLEGFGSTAGASIKWFRDNIGNSLTYKEIDKLIESTYFKSNISGGVMFFPHLGGTGSPEWYNADGGGFMGIKLDTTNTQMAAAVLESIAFNIKSNIEVMESNGSSFNSILAFGGGANSLIWLRIISDITEKRVVVTDTEESACLGAALKCSEALEISGKINREIKTRVFPNANKKAEYTKKYRIYKKLEKKIFGG